jgi:two-component system sensor histidine kinase UhpB
MAIHADEKRPNAEKHLLSTRAIAAGMLDSIHRLVADLRPSLLDDLGLLPAIAWYGEKRLKPLHLDLRLESNLQAERLAPPVESTLFRIVQEAMTNIVRHAQASLVSVSLHVQDGCIVLIVADNGQGFRLTPVGYTPADDRGVGLRGMQERAAILGGDCQIRSTPGEGTIITVTIPYPYQAHRTHVPAGVAAAQPSVGS